MPFIRLLFTLGFAGWIAQPALATTGELVEKAIAGLTAFGFSPSPNSGLAFCTDKNWCQIDVDPSNDLVITGRGQTIILDRAEADAGLFYATCGAVLAGFTGAEQAIAATEVVAMFRKASDEVPAVGLYGKVEFTASRTNGLQCRFYTP